MVEAPSFIGVYIGISVAAVCLLGTIGCGCMMLYHLSKAKDLLKQMDVPLNNIPKILGKMQVDVAGILTRKERVPKVKKVQCPRCNWTGTEQDLNSSWDWAGPHCPGCGQSGFEMLEAVTGPIVSGRQGL